VVSPAKKKQQKAKSTAKKVASGAAVSAASTMVASKGMSKKAMIGKAVKTVAKGAVMVAKKHPVIAGAALAVGAAVAGKAIYNKIKAGKESGQRRHRRINPSNARAARKAAARLKSSVKLLRSIEKLANKAVGGRRSAPRSRSAGFIDAVEARRALRT